MTPLLRTVAPNAGSRGSRLTAPPGLPAPIAAADIRFREVAGRVVVTNEAGHSAQLAPEQFRAYLGGSLPADDPARAELEAGGFIRDRMDFPALAGRWRSVNGHLWSAPTLHIVVLTLRCNHKCLYCHSSAVDPSRTDMDMTLETSRQTVDFILSTPSPSVMIEFQGGEPLLNWPVLRFVVEYARARAERAGKSVAFSLVSNMSLMTEERLDWLLERGVALCTSLDGPEALHRRNRIYLGGNAHERVTHWLGRIRERREGGERGEGPRVLGPNALMTTTRFSLPLPREIVDEYAALGLEGIFLRPLSPVGFAKRVWPKIGYTPAEWIAFYREALDHILELNYAGREFTERQAVILLAKVLKGADTGYVDLRSPAGGVLGCLAYNYDGGIFTTDEGRMAHHEGDPMFQVGHAASDRMNGVLESATTRAYVRATALDAQPLCSQCAYKPFCGNSPEFNYETQATLWGRMPANGHCAVTMGIFDALFEKLRDPKAARVFESWLAPRRRDLPAAPAGAPAIV